MKETGFWAEGRQPYLRALGDEELAEVRALEQELTSEQDAARRSALRESIERVRAKFLKRRRDVDHSLFARS